jgi:hypothetical protein
MVRCVFNQNGMCQRMNLKTFDDCRCPLYRMSVLTCAVCGQPILDGGAFWYGTDPVCKNCNATRNNCQSCVRRNQCAFETDPSPVPKMIQQTVRQGNMVSSFLAKNPERIALTCVNQKCPCYAGENACSRDLGSCAQWEWVAKVGEVAARPAEEIVPSE